jgi:putative membrane protein
MLWIKAFHIVFVVAWFAGLFYLPRLFVYHADASDPVGVARFKVMERRLLVMTHLGALGTLGCGSWLMFSWWWPAPLWLQVKLGLVGLLLAYHAWCWRLVLAFAADRNLHSSRWFRWFNEVPTVLLVATVLLVELQPT